MLPLRIRTAVKSVTVNGEKIEGKLILDSILKAENDIVIEL